MNDGGVSINNNSSSSSSSSGGGSGLSCSGNKSQIDLPRPPEDLPRQMYENLPLKERGHNNVGGSSTRSPTTATTPPTPAPRNCIY